jgi:putative DNA primase/helicase
MDDKQVTATIEKFRKRAGQKPRGNTKGVDAEIKRLAGLSPVQYERERKNAAEKLGVRATILDRLVRAERPGDDKQGGAISFSEPQPWTEAVDGAALLESVSKAIGSHVVMPDYSRDAAALWVVHTYLIDCFLVSPRLAIRSPVKRCGKTTTLDVIGRLVLRPLPTANVTAAAVFRVVEAYRPALLVDEADTFLRDNDELRGVINSGHRRGGSVVRTVGDDHEPRAFSTYSPCAIALIGKLPDTLHDRSVVIDLKRRLPSEKITPFRPDRADYLDVLARKVARWTKDNAAGIADADPNLPAGVYNREADNWRPLLAIAEAAGGQWPKRAREAVEKSRDAVGDDESRLVVLLVDIKAIFTEAATLAARVASRQDTDRLASSDLVDALVKIEGRPWAEYGKTGKPLSQNQLARMLKPLGIAPEVIRIGDKKTPRGYLLSQFTEAFERYLPAEGASKPQQCNKCDEIRTSDIFQTATPESDVAVEKCEKPNNDGLCCGVAVEKGDNGLARANGEPWPRVCDHCGGPERPGSPIQECWVAGEQYWLHRGACQHGFGQDDDLTIPASLRRVP